jgi:hypothetical protein
MATRRYGNILSEQYPNLDQPSDTPPHLIGTAMAMMTMGFICYTTIATLFSYNQ